VTKAATARWTRPKIDFVDPRTLPFVETRSRGELPHLYKEGSSYFVTFRLWDAVDSNFDADCGAAVPAAGVSSAGETPAPQHPIIFCTNNTTNLP
jgi:hypothetical protein